MTPTDVAGSPGHSQRVLSGETEFCALVACQGNIPLGASGPGVYQRQPAELAHMRRAASDAATSHKRLELQVGQVETEFSDAGSQRLLDAVRREHAAVRSQEERVVIACRHLVAEAPAFQDAREAVRAARIGLEKAVDTTWAQTCGDADTHAARSGHHGTGIADAAGPGHQPFRLSELRPGARESTEIRIRFTPEPPGTAVLLAAGSESERLWRATLRVRNEGAPRNDFASSESRRAGGTAMAEF
jgi:hypothetical protein